MTDADIVALDEVARSTGRDLPHGITDAGFVVKPLGRILDEKLATARTLFGDDIDLTSASALRKILELSAVEDARLWSTLGEMFDSSFVSTASGDALSRRGEELGIPRPHTRASGVVTIAIEGEFANFAPEVAIPRGTRLLTAGGHDYFVVDSVVLTAAAPSRTTTVRAFEPGPEHQLDPSLADGAVFPQMLAEVNPYDPLAQLLEDVAAATGAALVITHDEATTGGDEFWPDDEYRDLLLASPRNVWTPDAIRTAVMLVPGVRQAIVQDKYGGLDINQAIHGNFNFFERLFSEERSLSSPYYFSVLVAPEEGAIWEGPGQLRERVESAIDEVRPIAIHPNVEVATQIGVSLSCQLWVEGIPLPGGTRAAVDGSREGRALKRRILARIRRYVNELRIGEPVRFSEVVWAIMEEPGVTNVSELSLVRYPGRFSTTDLDTKDLAEVFGTGEDIQIGPREIAVLLDLTRDMVIQ